MELAMTGPNVGVRPRAHRALSTVTVTALIAAVMTFGAGAQAANAASRTWPVELGEAPVTVVAAYPAADVPLNTDLLTLTLPSEFDWTPTDLAAPAPLVTWSIEKDGVVVGSTADPAAPDTGLLAGFGNKASVDVAELPTSLTVATGYVLRIHAAWAPDAPKNANAVVNLSAAFDVSAEIDQGGNVPMDLAFANATAETRTYDTHLDGAPLGGDRLHITALDGTTPWTWATGPDVDSPWTSAPVVSGGLGTPDTDAAHALQPFHGPFSISTPDHTVLVVPLPDVFYAGSTQISLAVASKDAPTSGPTVTAYVNVTADFSASRSALKADTAAAITGKAMYGWTLHVTPGTWEPVSTGDWGNAPITFAYQWFRGSTAIAGATTTSYYMSPLDVGQGLSVRVTARASGYVSTSVTTPRVVVAAAAAPRAVVRPTLSGVARSGRTLTARPGTWSPAVTTFRYQWLLGGTPIRGASKSTLLLPSGWSGRYISCRVTAVLPGRALGIRDTAVLRVL